MIRTPQTHESELDNLNDTDLILANPMEDIRGLKVLDSSGSHIGHVDDLFVDRAERRIRMLDIGAGGFLGIGDRHFLLPVDSVTSVAHDGVHVNQSRDRIVDGPVYDPKLIELPTRASWEPFYGYYGVSPFWGNGYMYPNIPMALDEPPPKK